MLMRGNTTGALADLQAEGRSERCPLPNQKQARFLDTDTERCDRWHRMRFSDLLV